MADTLCPSCGTRESQMCESSSHAGTGAQSIGEGHATLLRDLLFEGSVGVVLAAEGCRAAFFLKF